MRYPLNLDFSFTRAIHTRQPKHACNLPCVQNCPDPCVARTLNGKEFIRLLEDPTRVLNENPVGFQLEAAFAKYFSWNIRFVRISPSHSPKIFVGINNSRMLAIWTHAE